jgi:hypothetical protein
LKRKQNSEVGTYYYRWGTQKNKKQKNQTNKQTSFPKAKKKKKEKGIFPLKV